MKLPTLLLLGLVSSAPALLAFAPHPTVLTVKYKDKLLPVVRVEDTDPFVMVDGKEVRIRSNPIYLAQDATDFSDNFVTAPRGGLGGTMKLQVDGGHAENFDMTNAQDFHMNFEVVMSAKDTLKGACAMLVLYAPDTFSNQPHATPAEVIVHQLPDLPAGQNVTVKFFARRIPRTAEPHYFVQIYDSTGKEVRTSQNSFAAKFYGLRDRARFERGLEKYLAKYKDADHDAIPAITPKPLFTPNVALPKGEITVTLTVEPDGSVSAVNAGNIGDSKVRDLLTETMGGWLFLPRLKAGQPVATMVQVPLEF